MRYCFTLKRPTVPKIEIQNIEKQMVSYKSTAKEFSFERSHHRIWSRDSKDRTTQHVTIIDSETEMVNSNARPPLLANEFILT